MNRRVRFYGILGVAASLAVCRAVAQPGIAKKRPKASVNLVSSVEAIVPGEEFDVGLRFDLAAGWHIYWQNSGQSGLPPHVTWSLPEGFAAGEVQYPIPKRHLSPGNIVTNILDNDPVLLVRISPPAAITAKRVSLAADVQYLICNKTCLRETAKLTLELPVEPAGSKVKEANADLFRRARRALPKKSSKYLSVVADTNPRELAPGRDFELLVNVAIKRGFHIQSHEPLNPAFIKCDVFLERVPGVSFDEPVYPPPRFRTIKHVGKVSEYAGRITIRVPGRLDGKAPAPPHRLGGVFKYQACNQKGTCFPPDALAFSVSFAGDQQAASQPATSPGSPESDTGLSSGSPTTDSATTQTRPGAARAGASGEGAERLLDDDGGDGAGFPGRWSLVGLLLGCFVYGLFINATPCVLPLLSIKVLGFVQQAHESRGRTLALGLVFGAGVMVLFVVLGLLASAGKNVLQYPAAVVGLGAVVMALALSMLGVYTLQVPTTATKLEAQIKQEGLLASFGKGALAPVLGFACTGPLLAGAFGWATQQPPHIAILAFLSAGLGMASPYMLLGANPNWLSFLPKPGPWMITFERIMGFILLAMVIWLLHPLVKQLGPEGLEWTLVFLVAVAVGCWMLGRVQVTMPAATRWRYRGGAATVVAGAGVLIYGWVLGQPSVEIPWRPWSAEAVEREVRAGKIAFVDFTAAYCTVCKANKAAAINTKETRDKLEELGVVAFQGDFTSGDPEIFAELQKHGRAGVPLNLIYPAGRPNDPIVLRPNLTKQYLLNKLDEASLSRTASMSRMGSY